MELTKETKGKFLQIKEDSVVILSSINSLYSRLVLKRFEIECLYHICLLVDDILLGRLDTERHSAEIIIMARLIEIELILGASDVNEIKVLIENMKQINV